MISASELFCQQVNANAYLSEWKNKIEQKLKTNGYKLGEPTEETIVNYAMDFIQDYHNAVNIGQLWSDNRLPNEKDIEVFAKIGATLLYEWQSVSSSKHPGKVQEGISKKLSETLRDNNED